MIQDEVFIKSEGNAWFRRNKETLLKQDRADWPIRLISLLRDKDNIHQVLELGCSNGWRLNRLRDLLTGEFVGVDVSAEAIEDGRKRYSNLNLMMGTVSSVPLKTEFDLVIVNFVLHWVDRRTLAKSVAEIDRLVKNEGYLLIGDFLPDCQERRIYHHRLDEEIFTYKQDYPRLFESLGTYKEIARVTFDHSEPFCDLGFSGSSARCLSSVLRKSLDEYYQK